MTRATKTLTPNDVHHVILDKRNWSPSVEELLKLYSRWDTEHKYSYECFEEYLLAFDEREAWSLFAMLEEMDVGIRPVGFEFYTLDEKANQ